MANEQVARLYRAAQNDPALKEKLNTAPDLESFVLMAQKAGYDFTVDEWKAMTGFSVEEFESKLSEIPGL
jgi:predicted ribosomally synthesized peptide with nif11-like leader